MLAFLLQFRGNQPALVEPSESEIREELARILASPAFSGSHRSQAFLKYVVQEQQAGRGEEIKERTIAIAVFGRDAAYDNSQDSIVRVKASEVRKRLGEYYKVNSDARVHIDLPIGGYVPVFRPLGQGAVKVPPKREKGRTLRIGVGLLACLVIAVLAAVAVRVAHRSPIERAFEGLWGPVVKSGAAPLIVLPSPEVHQVDEPMARNEWIAKSELRRMKDYYVGVGAAYGAAQFAGVLAGRGSPFVIKVVPDVSYVDLRRQPVLLLGAFTSSLSLEFSETLRYRFERRPDDSAIVDSMEPDREWRQPRGLDSDATKSAYAMIARIWNEKTGQVTLIAAGIDARGTYAAAEFLTEPPVFWRFASTAPTGWENRNFQVVIGAEVHGSTPARPRVLATHVW
ncbi:MAG: hypothetical protein ACK5AZ_07565 [Bryobacteraceae bacterium]